MVDERRAEPSKPSAAITAAVDRIRLHSQVESAVRLDDLAEGPMRYECLIQTNPPTQYAKAGISATGIRALEPVRLSFHPDFPRQPPDITLRADFPRDHPHIQPGLPGSPPVPCYIDGDPRELLAQLGIDGIINQLVGWLHKAAKGTLIDLSQGWEPVRRDSLDDFIALDSHRLRNIVDTRGGFKFFATQCLRLIPERRHQPEKGHWLRGHVVGKAQALDERKFAEFRGQAPHDSSSASLSKTVCLLVYPGKLPSGESFVCDQYQPETVHDLDSMLLRAADYGCEKPLRDGLGWVARRVASRKAPIGELPLFVLMVARRPCNVIGTDSPLELCPYVFYPGDSFNLKASGQTPVYPVGLHDTVTPELLARLSAVAVPEVKPSWVQLGAGSLGSKVATHLGRAGLAPQGIVDNRYLSPHNSARHALTYPEDEFGLTWFTPKAQAMSTIMAGLGQTTQPIIDDVVAWPYDPKAMRAALPKGTRIVVNSTASLAVRDALAAIKPDNMPARVVETALYSQGSAGLLTLEGPCRNPNCVDLVLHGYAMARCDRDLGQRLFAQTAQLERLPIGAGCGTTTMAVSDACISLYAAAMAQKLMDWQTGELPPQGELFIGGTGDDGMGLEWAHSKVAPFTMLVPDNAPDWQVRVSPDVCDKMQQEVARYPAVETGGLLIGARSDLHRTITVVDTLDAPADSVRQPNRFDLGVEGLSHAVEEYAQATGNALYCIGTWHSHLSNSGASSLDHETLATLADRIEAPALGLICLPDGYTAIVGG